MAERGNEVSVTPVCFRVVHCGIGVEHQFPFVFRPADERYSPR